MVFKVDLDLENELSAALNIIWTNNQSESVNDHIRVIAFQETHDNV